MNRALAAARLGAHGFKKAPSGNGIQSGVTLWAYHSRIKLFFKNNTYEALLKKLPDADGKEKLKQNQRAWIVFRDSEGAFAAGQTRVGLMAPTIKTSL
ncbi:MAG TPA: lysozyme inhibitor LprI family protein [Candidatus Udaeobacter sp.]